MKRIWFLLKCVLLALAVFAAFRASEEARLRYAKQKSLANLKGTTQ